MERMKLSRADWPHLRKEASIAFVASLFGLVVAGGAYRFHGAAGESQRQAEAALQVAQVALANGQNERAELEASLPYYRSLVDRAVIGDEQRLDWHETLRSEQIGRGLPKIAFSLAPRRPFDLDAAGAAAWERIFRRYRSPMKLNLEFQRETAFVEFLEGVAGRASALPIVRGCRIGRQGDPGQAGAGILGAECLVDWATLERAAPRQGQEPS